MKNKEERSCGYIFKPHIKEFKSAAAVIKYFRNEKICAEYLEQQRWNGKPLCPHCGSEHHYRTKTQLKSPELEGYKDFRCKTCRKKYSVLTGTIFHKTKLSLKTWFLGIYTVITRTKGISSIQLALDLEITQKTAWFMLHKIREILKDDAPEIIPASSIVEVDETYIGGENKNRHWDRRKENSQGRSLSKTPVVGYCTVEVRYQPL